MCQPNTCVSVGKRGVAHACTCKYICVVWIKNPQHADLQAALCFLRLLVIKARISALMTPDIQLKADCIHLARQQYFWNGGVATAKAIPNRHRVRNSVCPVRLGLNPSKAYRREQCIAYWFECCVYVWCMPSQCPNPSCQLPLTHKKSFFFFFS